MPDDLTKIGKADDTRINIEQEHEVSYWAEKFGVSRDELRSAVAKAGPDGKECMGASALGEPER